MIFGKTNTPEFGAKGVTEPDYWGPARNPWDTERTPGGSSGGSGAAVAAGIVPAAGANDGGGSIRIPAACNGLVGLKPSRGLAPYGPQTGELMLGMATQGVVTRTVRDSAALLDAIIGHHPDASYRVALPDKPLPNRSRASGTSDNRVLGPFGAQPAPGPRGRRRRREQCGPAERVRPPGARGCPALRRRRAGA